MTETIDADVSEPTTDLAVNSAAHPALQMDYANLERLASACAASGYFKDATDAAKAYVKIVAGAELGVGPVQAMTGIHVVQGKPTLSASLVGALIKRSGRYDYRVENLDDNECTLGFYENGERVGDSIFTMADAEKAKLLGNQTWKNYPRNMLLSRALTNGARWYCPDVFGGAVYTPDELGEAIDGETGEVIVKSSPVERRAPAVADEDVPFDKTGPQGPDADGMKAHGEHATGTGASTPPPAMTRAEANEVRRFALTERLHELCAILGKDENDTSKLIAADRMKNETKLASHLTWLEKQVRNAETAVDAQTEIPL